jgi:hypothetical protein
MKLIIAAALAATAVVGLAAPASAQPYGPPPGDHPHMDHGPMVPGGWDINRRIDWMQQRINQGRMDGSLDRHEARRVERELGSIRGEAERARMSHGGRLNDFDRQRLQDRLDHLNDQIHWLRNNDVRRPW